MTAAWTTWSFLLALPLAPGPILQDGLCPAPSAPVPQHEDGETWHRRAQDARAEGPEAADATYDQLRQALRLARDALGDTLDLIAAADAPAARVAPSSVAPPPEPGAPAALEPGGDPCRRREHAQRREAALGLLSHVGALNSERLDLLPHLSDAKRQAVTGFTAAGWDQARSEARHLVLILRYHRLAARTWGSHASLAGTLPQALRVLAPWLLVWLTMAWARRSSLGALRDLEQRLVEATQMDRRAALSLALRAARFSIRIQPTLFLGMAFGLAELFIPHAWQALLEYRLLALTIAWVLGGRLGIEAINAWAQSAVSTESAELRLRSLRLVGRTVVAAGLFSDLTARLVGEGTLCGWVLWTGSLASVPILLTLVHWWRSTVFQRLAQSRQKSALHTWLLANQRGYRSALAATVAAIYLFAVGAYRVVRRQVFNFDLTKRAHAYLFMRELGRLEEQRPSRARVALDVQIAAALSPKVPSSQHVASPADPLVALIVAKARSGQSALWVVVGGRGMGKSTVLDQVQQQVPQTQRVRCGPTTAAVDMQVALNADSPGPILVDDAQHLAKPFMGGLAALDQSIAAFRARPQPSVCVCAMDALTWLFVSRARDSHQICDEVHVLSKWKESQLASLVQLRCQEAQIAPSYEDLLEPAAPGSDELDRQEALWARTQGYGRMLWGYARGNPGVALETWRNSLAQNAAGRVFVRPLQQASLVGLEGLPEASLRVLRAILHMAPAHPDELVAATGLAPLQVALAVAAGQARGYLTDEGGRTAVQGRWLRSILRILERHHLVEAT